jgi:hypothetical protein
MAENSVQAAPVGLVVNVATTALAGAGTTMVGSAFLLSLFYMSTKTKVLVAAVVLAAIVSTVAFSWPSAAAKLSANSSSSIASTPSVAALSVRPVAAQVEMPVVPAAIPSKSPAAGTDSTAATGDAAVVTNFVAVPQADLKSAILTGIHFLESQDVPSVLRTLMPPDELTGKTGPTGLPLTFEDYAQRVSKDRADMMPNLLVSLHAIQNLTPIVSPDGQSASFILDQPLNEMKDLDLKNADIKKVDFEKVDGFWYLK